MALSVAPVARAVSRCVSRTPRARQAPRHGLRRPAQSLLTRRCPPPATPPRVRTVAAAADGDSVPAKKEEEREYDEDGLYIGELTVGSVVAAPPPAELLSSATPRLHVSSATPRHVSGTYSTFWTDPEQLKGVVVFCSVLAAFFSLGNVGAAIVLPLLYNKPIELCAPAILLGYPC